MTAALALGVLPHALRRTAKSVGIVLPPERRGIPKGSPGYEKRWGKRDGASPAVDEKTAPKAKKAAKRAARKAK